MTKETDTNDIIATRPLDLLMDVLWDDPAIVAKIQNKLNEVSASNMRHYHAHFCGESTD